MFKQAKYINWIALRQRIQNYLIEYLDLFPRLQSDFASSRFSLDEKLRF